MSISKGKCVLWVGKWGKIAPMNGSDINNNPNQQVFALLKEIVDGQPLTVGDIVEYELNVDGPNRQARSIRKLESAYSSPASSTHSSPHQHQLYQHSPQQNQLPLQSVPERRRRGSISDSDDDVQPSLNPYQHNQPLVYPSSYCAGLCVGPSLVDSSFRPTQWACSRCTFDNHANANNCGMCGAPVPTRPYVPIPLGQEIDEDEELRKNLHVDDLVEVFSETLEKWVAAKIIDAGPRGVWLSVRYLTEPKTKDIRRTDPGIRPIPTRYTSGYTPVIQHSDRDSTLCSEACTPEPVEEELMEPQILYSEIQKKIEAARLENARLKNEVQNQRLQHRHELQQKRNRYESELQHDKQKDKELDAKIKSIEQRLQQAPDTCPEWKDNDHPHLNESKQPLSNTHDPTPKTQTMRVAPKYEGTVTSANDCKKQLDIHATHAQSVTEATNNTNIDKENEDIGHVDDTENTEDLNSHVLALSEPYHIHVVSDDKQSGNSNIITEDEVTSIINSVETDVLAEMMQSMAHLNSKINEMIQCSNRKDDDYNAAFASNNGGGTNASHRDCRRQSRHNKNNRNRDDDNKQNEDRDDQKYDPDEPYNPSLQGDCNHLRECIECSGVFTRKCEENKMLKQILQTLQQQMQFFTNLFSKCKQIKGGNNQTKNKFNSMSCGSMAESNTKHDFIDLYPSYRAKKNIKLSRKMTQTIVPNATKEPISNGYAFMEKSIGMQCNDGQIQNNTDAEYQILNCDLDNKYCIMKRMPASNANYKYQIEDELFTASQAKELTGSGHLPHSSRVQLQRMSARHDIKQFTFNVQSIRRILKQCKWNKIHVFKRKENKQRMTLSMPQEQLNPMIARSMLSIDKTHLMPILMFDNASNTHWIEYILPVHIGNDIDIGISLRYDSKGVQITGIHLDKVMILEQHEVLLSHSQCHCLDGFTSIIHDMHVGNCDALKNEMKNYKEKYHNFKLLALKFINGKDTEKYQILQKYAEMTVLNDNGLSYNLFPDIHSTTNSTSSRPSSPSSLSYDLQSPDPSLSSRSDTL